MSLLHILLTMFLQTSGLIRGLLDEMWTKNREREVAYFLIEGKQINVLDKKAEWELGS